MRREFYCRNCKKQLRVVSTSTGKVLLALMVLVPSAGIFGATTGLLSLSDTVTDWLLATLMLLVIPYTVWGTRLESR